MKSTALSSIVQPSSPIESSTWKNPREQMRRHLKRRTSSRRILTNSNQQSLSSVENQLWTASEPAFDLDASDSVSSGYYNYSVDNRSNPFKLSPSIKRRRKPTNNDDDKENTAPVSYFADDDNSNANLTFPSLLHRLELATGRRQTGGDSIAIKPLNELIAKDIGDLYPGAAIDFSILSHSTPKLTVDKLSTAITSSAKQQPIQPIDLRLGTKLRIVSNRPYPWMSISEEKVDRKKSTSGNIQVDIDSADIDAGVRLFTSQSSEIVESAEYSFLSRLHAASLYWQYPDIAWQCMYPRFDDRSRLMSSRDTIAPSIASFGSACVNALGKQWENSFEQLYQSWRYGIRRSFYVCCQNFTVIFIRVNDFHRAVITPTTYGLRQILRDNDIQFEMPLRSSTSGGDSRRSSLETSDGDIIQSQSPMINTVNDEVSLPTMDEVTEHVVVSSSDNDTSSNESDHAAWLQDIGISPMTTLKLRRYSSIASDKSVASVNSNTDKSTHKSALIIINNSSLDILYRLIATNKICRNVIGSQAGLPPTLLADQSFHNAALKCLNKTSTISKRNDREMRYTLEVDGGAILPSCVSRIVSLLVNNGTNDGIRLSISVLSRSINTGMNEAVDTNQFTDVDEFVYENGSYCW